MSNGGGRFSDGLILGLVVGGAAVFLLGTENGKKIFKVLTEEGSEALSSVLEDLEHFEQERQVQKPKPKVLPKKEPLTIVEAESLDFREAPSDTESVEEFHEGLKEATEVKHKPARRFFKKSK